MKIKLVDMLNSVDILEKLNQEKFNDGITTYRLARNIKNINVELDNVDAAKLKLMAKYAKKNDDGSIKQNDKGVAEFIEELKEEYNKEISSLLQQEVDIDILQINPEKLSGHSPMEILPIFWMLSEEV